MGGGHDPAMKSRVHPKYKTKYRVGHWAEYDRALARRGDITFWISTDATKTWKPAPSGKRGGQVLTLHVSTAQSDGVDQQVLTLHVSTAQSDGVDQQRKLSDQAIETALILRLVFKLPLRQAEGFLRSVLLSMGVDLEAPDQTTLSRRSQRLDVPLHLVPIKGPIHLIVDSTGLSIVGEGE
jgi:hypothetical protein